MVWTPPWTPPWTPEVALRARKLGGEPASSASPASRGFKRASVRARLGCGSGGGRGAPYTRVVSTQGEMPGASPRWMGARVDPSAPPGEGGSADAPFQARHITGIKHPPKQPRTTQPPVGALTEAAPARITRINLHVLTSSVPPAPRRCHPVWPRRPPAPFPCPALPDKRQGRMYVLLHRCVTRCRRSLRLFCVARQAGRDRSLKRR